MSRTSISMRFLLLITIISVVLMPWKLVCAFTIDLHHYHHHHHHPVLSRCRTHCILSRLQLKPNWFAPDEEYEEDDDNHGLVTREMFQRDLLRDPEVKRKRRGGGGGGKNHSDGGYKPLDNRDHLPFSVKKVTPDPYTHPERKKAKAQRTNTPKSDLDHHLAPSRLIQKSIKGDASTFLGEFKLDKSTTSGDLIIIGDKEFEVQTARCQYKYAGGKRFVMVRKILEVKEVARVLKEELLMKQYKKSESLLDQPPLLE